jgi:hypothetical protein
MVVQSEVLHGVACRSEQNFGWYFQSRSESGKLPVTEEVMQSPAVNPAGI